MADNMADAAAQAKRPRNAVSEERPPPSCSPPPDAFETCGSMRQTEDPGESTAVRKSQYKDVRCVLFFAREMEAMAREIAENSNGKIILGSVWWNRFPDQFPNIYIERAHSLKWCHVAFLCSLHCPSVIFEQLSLMYAIPKYMAKTFKVVIPFFPTATMERISSYGEVATAMTLARMLSGIPSACRGPVQISIFDIHTLQNRFYFSDTVLIHLDTCIQLLCNRLRQLPDFENVCICFPDEGASKRFGNMLERFDIVTCHKVRNGDERIVKLKEGSVVGRHAVIVDDLVQSGGTLLQCAKTLKGSGALKVSAYVTHAVFPGESWKKFEGNSALEYFWMSDSHPVTRLLHGRKPFEVLSMARNVMAILLDE